MLQTAWQLMSKKQNLNKLYEVWERKLKDSGFVDIEKTVNGERVLAQFSNNAYRQVPAVSRETKEQYYRIIYHKAQETQFKSFFDKVVMRLYAEGFSLSDIARLLSIHRQTVRFTVRRFENQWNLKNWLPHQMNLKAPIK